MNDRYFSSFNFLQQHFKHNYFILVIIIFGIAAKCQYYQSVDGCVAISSSNCIKFYPNPYCPLLETIYLSGYTYRPGGSQVDITYGWTCNGVDLVSLEGVILPPMGQPQLNFNETCNGITWQRRLYSSASMMCSSAGSIHLVYNFDNNLYQGDYIIRAPTGTPDFQIPPQVKTFSSSYIFPNCSANITALPKFCNLNLNFLCQLGHIRQPFATPVDHFAIISNITKSNFNTHSCLRQQSYCFKRTDTLQTYLYYSTYYSDGLIPVQQPGYCVGNVTCSPLNRVQLENFGVPLNELGYPLCINEYVNNTVPSPQPDLEPLPAPDQNNNESIHLPVWLIATLSVIGFILMLCLIVLVLRLICCATKTIFM